MHPPGPLVGVKRPFGGLILGGPKPAGRVARADNGALRMRSGGFTLIELLVALAIMAIVSAIAVPLYPIQHPHPAHQRRKRPAAVRTEHGTTREYELFVCRAGGSGRRYRARDAEYLHAVDDDVCNCRDREREHVHNSRNTDVGAVFNPSATGS